MINSNKIYFIASPLGQYSSWCFNNLETLLHLNDNNKIYFRFGASARLDFSSGVSPYDRISLVIKDQVSNFHDTNFFYYGWEVVPCLDELYRDFPESEFFLIVNNLNDTELETLDNGKMLKYNTPEFLSAVADSHRATIKNFISNKACTVRVREKKSDNGTIERSITTYHLKN
jgi:hypothetical protein